MTSEDLLQRMATTGMALFRQPRWRIAHAKVEDGEPIRGEIAKAAIRRRYLKHTGKERYVVSEFGLSHLKKQRVSATKLLELHMYSPAGKCETHGAKARRCTVDGIVIYPCCEGEHTLCRFCREGDEQYRRIAPLLSEGRKIEGKPARSLWSRGGGGGGE